MASILPPLGGRGGHGNARALPEGHARHADFPRAAQDVAARSLPGGERVREAPPRRARGARRPPGGGAVELGTDLHERPNGLAFSPDFKVRHRSPVDSLKNLLTFRVDGQTLWVADSSIRNPTWSGYTVQADQSLGKAHTVLCQATLGAKVRTIPCPSSRLCLALELSLIHI